MDRKADLMCVRDKGRRIAEISKQSARDDQRLIGANAIGIYSMGVTIGGVMAQQSTDLLKSFFARKRN